MVDRKQALQQSTREEESFFGGKKKLLCGQTAFRSPDLASVFYDPILECGLAISKAICHSFPESIMPGGRQKNKGSLVNK